MKYERGLLKEEQGDTQERADAYCGYSILKAK